MNGLKTFAQCIFSAVESLLSVDRAAEVVDCSAVANNVVINEFSGRCGFADCVNGKEGTICYKLQTNACSCEGFVIKIRIVATVELLLLLCKTVKINAVLFFVDASASECGFANHG